MIHIRKQKLFNRLKKITPSLMISIFFTHKTFAQALSNPLGNVNDIPTFIGIIIKGLLGVVGSLSLIMFIYGGFLWITSGGNEDNIKKGKETLKWAILGIMIVFSSYALLTFVLDIIGGTYGT